MKIGYETGRLELTRLASWEPIDSVRLRADRFSRERTEVYNRFLHRIQKARMGTYPTPTGGERHVFFDARGRKHILERHRIYEHVKVARAPGLVRRQHILLLDEVVFDPADGHLERLTQRWRLSDLPTQGEVEVLERAFREGLELLEEGPSMRTIYRRTGNRLTGYEVLLTRDPAVPTAPATTRMRTAAVA